MPTILAFDFYKLIVNQLPEGTSEEIQNIVGVFSQLVIWTLVFFILKSLLMGLLEDHLPRLKFRHQSLNRSKTIHTIILNATKYTLYFIFAYIFLSILGVPVGTLLAGAGVVGVAIGLGAQQLIKDVINGFFIIFENQFEVNDWVTLPQMDISGAILDVGIRTTAIQAASGDIFYIPNSEISIVNNQSRSVRTVNIDLPMSTQIPMARFEDLLHQTSQTLNLKYQDRLDGETLFVGPIKVSDQSFNYRISFQVTNGEHYLLQALLYRDFLKALQDQDIYLPDSVYK